MRRYLLMILAVSLLAAPVFSMGLAVDTAVNEIGFAGFAYDDGPFGAAGLGKRIIGPAWGFVGTEVGAEQNVVVEIAYLFPLKHFRVFLIWTLYGCLSAVYIR